MVESSEKKRQIMKIAIISLANRLGGTTGDCVQADKTADALRSLGQDVLRCFLKGGIVLNSEGLDLGTWQNVLGDYDVVHTIPPIPWTFLKRLPKIKAKLVCSTVFWRSYTYVRVIHKISRRLTGFALKEYIRVFLAWLGIPSYWSYQGFDLLLPNSEAEIHCFRRFCHVKASAKIKAVPNAIDPIPGSVSDIPRPIEAPAGDYVVVPAVFATRKNQRSFIEAMNVSRFPIVFLGDGPWLEECKKIARDGMYFLGHVAHGSELFYGLLKYARVVCLPSNCETPGIAGLEAAALGARPVVPREGGTEQYYGWEAEYLDPLDAESIKTAVENAFCRGRIPECNRTRFSQLTWKLVAERTLSLYQEL